VHIRYYLFLKEVEDGGLLIKGGEGGGGGVEDTRIWNLENSTSRPLNLLKKSSVY